ncbi:AraC family transcriptional regulator [Butyrivibrio sp. VCD2006]|uniref:AraC family transcriptional regulator n=1 Tax=Butyrivibrio sp. VCD2006 TaxID=1280664 RepID=UPI0003FBE62B|nr:AraC family transcriptional regulator [Butyrivibrio sp. VCD2006]
MEEKNSIDKIAYHDRNIGFMMEGESVFVGNIVYECFHRSIPLHAHSDNSYEIHYISSGYGKVTISGKEYETGPGTLYITGPKVKHSMIPDKKDPLSEYCVYLKLSPDLKNDKRMLSPLRIFRATKIWYGKDKHGINSLMKSLFRELKDENIGYRESVESLIKQIIVACVRDYAVNEGKTDYQGFKSNDDQYLTIEEAFLYEYATLTLTTLAGRLSLSTRQTQRLLMEHYGMNFQSKRTEAKMSAAAIMLRSPDITVTRIADELGYSSVEHFSSAFKKYYDMSASQYRDELSVNAQ